MFIATEQEDLSGEPAQSEFLKGCALQLWTNALLLEGTVAEPEAAVGRSQALMEEAASRRGPNPL